MKFLALDQKCESAVTAVKVLPAARMIGTAVFQAPPLPTLTVEVAPTCRTDCGWDWSYWQEVSVREEGPTSIYRPDRPAIAAKR
jgi:hypothetical protein